MQSQEQNVYKTLISRAIPFCAAAVTPMSVTYVLDASSILKHPSANGNNFPNQQKMLSTKPQNHHHPKVRHNLTYWSSSIPHATVVRVFPLVQTRPPTGFPLLRPGHPAVGPDTAMSVTGCRNTNFGPTAFTWRQSVPGAQPHNPKQRENENVENE